MTKIEAIRPFPPTPAENRQGREGASPPDSPRTSPPQIKGIGPQKGTDPLTRAAEIVEAHLNEITGINKELRLEKNEDANRIVYKVIDRQSGEVVRQFPPETLLNLIAYYRQVEGLGVDEAV